MNKVAKILIFAKSIDGGTGVFIEELFKLNKILNDVEINLAILEQPTFRNKFKVKYQFFHTKSFYSEKYHFSLGFFFAFINEILWTIKLLTRLKPNIILSVDSHCLILSQIGKILFFKKIKLIATFHNNSGAVLLNKTPKIWAGLVKKNINYSLKQADAIVCVSKGLAHQLLNFYKLRTTPLVIYYALSSLYLKNTSKNQKTFRLKQSKTIITISRLFQQKDLKTIIQAFRLVQNKLLSISLRIIGDGPIKKRLQNLVKKLNLKSVKFYGWKENLLPLMKTNNIFVFSSNWEGFGLTIIEAMSQGLPVISTDTPFGPSEILDNGKYGILVPMKDPRAMANAMYQLLTDRKKYNYYAKKSLERAKYFSLDKMLQSYKKLILDVLN